MLHALAIIVGFAAVVWLVSVLRRDVSIVDLAWGTGFVLLGWHSWWHHGASEWRQWLLLGAVSVWGVRLTTYLTWRNWGQPEDRRYAAMRQRRGTHFWWQSLYLVFGLQAVLLWMIAWPVLWGLGTTTWWGSIDRSELLPSGAMSSGSNLTLVTGMVLWGIGLFFETVGDYQLARFRADPNNRGRVLQHGLWRWTRHPNYFGDFCVWWGLFLMAYRPGMPFWFVISPCMISFLLMRVSGVPLLERSMVATKPGYAEYVRRTSSFFPRPPRP